MPSVTTDPRWIWVQSHQLLSAKPSTCIDYVYNQSRMDNLRNMTTTRPHHSMLRRQYPYHFFNLPLQGQGRNIGRVHAAKVSRLHRIWWTADSVFSQLKRASNTEIYRRPPVLMLLQLLLWCLLSLTWPAALLQLQHQLPCLLSLPKSRPQLFLQLLSVLFLHLFQRLLSLTQCKLLLSM